MRLQHDATTMHTDHYPAYNPHSQLLSESGFTAIIVTKQAQNPLIKVNRLRYTTTVKYRKSGNFRVVNFCMKMICVTSFLYDQTAYENVCCQLIITMRLLCEINFAALHKNFLQGVSCAMTAKLYYSTLTEHKHSNKQSLFHQPQTQLIETGLASHYYSSLHTEFI